MADKLHFVESLLDVHRTGLVVLLAHHDGAVSVGGYGHDVVVQVGKGLVEARGNYKIVAQLFNLESQDYKKFLNFLRKHDCQLPFKEYR